MPTVRISSNDMSRLDRLASARGWDTRGKALSWLLDLEDVSFAGYTASGAAIGEYRFVLPPTQDSVVRSVFVRAPLTPCGRPRNGLGIWFYRETSDQSWASTILVETVVGWICRRAELSPFMLAHGNRPN